MAILITLFTILAQNDDGSTAVAAGGGAFASLIQLVITVLLIAGMWKTFAKAGQPGWAAIIPFYNIYTLLKIVGRPTWWIILLFIPLVNIIILIIASIDMAKSFGKGTGFGIGLAVLSFIFYPLLGFGDAQYLGPAAANGVPTMARV